MPYTPELFNRYNEFVDKSRNAVCRHIQYLLKPNDGYPKNSDSKLKELYNIWRADCRAMDAACEEYVHMNARNEMIEMPVDDEEHLLCRRMAAVVIERNIYGEHNAQEYLAELVEAIKGSNCWKHPKSCACHYTQGWTYANQDLMNTLSAHYIEKGPAVNVYLSSLRQSCEGWRNCSCGGCSGGGPERAAPPPLRRITEHVVNCACSSCYNKRVVDGTQDSYMASLRAATDKVLAGEYRHNMSDIMVAARKADDAIVAAKNMAGGSTDDGFIKNLFKTVQGVEFDSKCPHSLPFYACMSCSH